jgi:uncharacterized membrane protein YkoI
MKTMQRLKVAVSLALCMAGFFATSVHAEAAKLSFAQVEKIALQRFPASTIHEIECDQERGREVFEVELRTKDGTKHELEIDAHSGEVLEVDDRAP